MWLLFHPYYRLWFIAITCCLACRNWIGVSFSSLWRSLDQHCYFIQPLRGLTGSALDHRSLPPEFESRCGHIWRVFHLWPHFITFGSRLAHLTYHAHRCDHKTSIIIIQRSLCPVLYLFNQPMDALKSVSDGCLSTPFLDHRLLDPERGIFLEQSVLNQDHSVASDSSLFKRVHRQLRFVAVLSSKTIIYAALRMIVCWIRVLRTPNCSANNLTFACFSFLHHIPWWHSLSHLTWMPLCRAFVLPEMLKWDNTLTQYCKSNEIITVKISAFKTDRSVGFT